MFGRYSEHLVLPYDSRKIEAVWSYVADKDGCSTILPQVKQLDVHLERYDLETRLRAAARPPEREQTRAERFRERMGLGVLFVPKRLKLIQKST